MCPINLVSFTGHPLRAIKAAAEKAAASLERFRLGGYAEDSSFGGWGGFGTLAPDDGIAPNDRLAPGLRVVLKERASV